MKMNIKGLVFVGFAAAVFASAANAANDKTVTSKTYVDEKYIGDNTTITVTENAAGKKVISLAEGLDGSPYSGTAPINVNQQDHTISVTVDGAVSDGNTGIVSGGTVYTAVDARVPKQIGTASDEGKVLTVNNQGQVALSAADEYQKKLTAGNFVAIDPSTNTITTTYSEGTGIDISNTGVISVDQAQLTNYEAGTNVTFTDTDNDGLQEINADDTTYAAGDHVTITGANNAIGVTVDGTITENNTGIVSGGTVYNYLNSNAVQSDYAQTDNTKPDFIKNKPAINDGTLTIQKNGTSVGTFTANSASGSTINIEVPTTPDIPTPASGSCTAAAPCALVWAGGTTPTWEPIQQ